MLTVDHNPFLPLAITVFSEEPSSINTKMLEDYTFTINYNECASTLRS